jgi:voltage-gated potassium channel
MPKEQLKRLLAMFFLIMLLLIFVGVSDYIFRGMSLYDSIVGAVAKIFGLAEGATGIGRGLMSLVLTFLAASATYYLITYLIDVFLNIHFSEMFMMNKVMRLKNHYIVCGAGRVGIHAAERLDEMKKKFVVIERDCELVEELRRRKYLVMVGDCTDEFVLKKAGIEKAKGIVCALGDNEDNFYLVITAKHMNPDIRVAARANSESMAKKMKVVGADTIVTPEVVGGRSLATSLIEI